MEVENGQLIWLVVDVTRCLLCSLGNLAKTHGVSMHLRKGSVTPSYQEIPPPLGADSFHPSLPSEAPLPSDMLEDSQLANLWVQVVGACIKWIIRRQQWLLRHKPRVHWRRDFLAPKQPQKPHCSQTSLDSDVWLRFDIVFNVYSKLIIYIYIFSYMCNLIRYRIGRQRVYCLYMCYWCCVIC